MVISPYHTCCYQKSLVSHAEGGFKIICLSGSCICLSSAILVNGNLTIVECTKLKVKLTNILLTLNGVPEKRFSIFIFQKIALLPKWAGDAISEDFK